MAQEPTLTENFDAIESGKLPAGWTVAVGKWQVRDGALLGKPADGEHEATLLGRIFLDVPVAAVDLHAEAADFEGPVGDIALGHRDQQINH